MQSSDVHQADFPSPEDLVREELHKPFPTDCFPSVVAAIILSAAEVHGVPEVMPGTIALTVIAAALGKGLRVIDNQGRATGPNVYCHVSADTGSGKSTVLKTMLEPLKSLEAFDRDLYQAQKAGGTKSETPAHLDLGDLLAIDATGGNPTSKNSGNSQEEPDKPRQLICSDITGPALARFLLENRGTAYNVTAEAGNVLDEASRQASPLGAIMLKAFSGDNIEIHRATREPITLDDPCMTVCWLCQPHRFEHFLSNPRLLEDGLVARFLVAHTDATMPMLSADQQGIPIHILDSYGALIAELYDAYFKCTHHNRNVEVTPEALLLLIEYHNQCAKLWRIWKGGMRSCVSRWAEQARRVALVLHAAEHRSAAHKIPLHAKTAASAITLVRWFSARQWAILKKVLPETPESDRYRRLVSLLESAPNRELTIRTVKTFHGFDERQLSEIVGQNAGVLEIIYRRSASGVGRRSRVVRLLPNSL